MADLYKNTGKRQMNLVSGFHLDPGEKVTLPHYVVHHPHTQAQINAGRLALVVEAKGTKPKKAADPAADFTPQEMIPEGSTVVKGDEVYKVGSVRRSRKKAAEPVDEAPEGGGE